MGAKLSFELDAGKVIAKLHLGGCQTLETVRFFNSGIVDNQKIKPEEADGSSITFDLDNKSGEYELGVVIRPEDFANLPKSGQAITDEVADSGVSSDNSVSANNGVSADNNLSSDDSGKPDDDKLSADAADKSEDKKAAITDNPNEMKESLMSVLFEADSAQEPRKNYQETKPGEPMDPVADLDPTATADEQQAQLQQEYKTADVPEQVQNALQKNRDAVKKHMEGMIDLAVGYLTQYMNVFCGPEEAAKIKARKKDIRVTFLPDKFADPYKIKKYDNYQIPALTEEEMREKKTEWIKKNPDEKKYPLINMCFKIGYSIDLGK